MKNYQKTVKFFTDNTGRTRRGIQLVGAEEYCPKSFMWFMQKLTIGFLRFIEKDSASCSIQDANGNVRVHIKPRITKHLFETPIQIIGPSYLMDSSILTSPLLALEVMDEVTHFTPRIEQRPGFNAEMSSLFGVMGARLDISAVIRRSKYDLSQLRTCINLALTKSENSVGTNIQLTGSFEPVRIDSGVCISSILPGCYGYQNTTAASKVYNFEESCLFPDNLEKIMSKNNISFYYLNPSLFNRMADREADKGEVFAELIVNDSSPHAHITHNKYHIGKDMANYYLTGASKAMGVPQCLRLTRFKNGNFRPEFAFSDTARKKYQRLPRKKWFALYKHLIQDPTSFTWRVKPDPDLMEEYVTRLTLEEMAKSN